MSAPLQVSRVAAALLLSGTLLTGYALGQGSRPAATVGDHNVPSGLHCADDAVIGVPLNPSGHAVCIHNEKGTLER